jgi:hypothetical protein
VGKRELSTNFWLKNSKKEKNKRKKKDRGGGEGEE